MKACLMSPSTFSCFLAGRAGILRRTHERQCLGDYIAGSRTGKNVPKSPKSADLAKPKILPSPILLKFSGKKDLEVPFLFSFHGAFKERVVPDWLVSEARWAGGVYLSPGRHEGGPLAVLGRQPKPPGSYALEGHHRK